MKSKKKEIKRTKIKSKMLKVKSKKFDHSLKMKSTVRFKEESCWVSDYDNEHNVDVIKHDDYDDHDHKNEGILLLFLYSVRIFCLF